MSVAMFDIKSKFPTYIFFLLVAVIFVVNGSERPVVTLIRGENDFVEDQPTKFSCRAPKGTKKISWFVRDPDKDIIALLTNKFLQKTRPFLVASDGLSPEYSLVMRRDFSNLQLVCQVFYNGPLGFILLPKIKKMLPVGDVLLGSTQLVRGDRLRLTCDVNTSKPVTVQFRDLHTFFDPTNHDTAGPYGSRYYLYKADTFVKEEVMDKKPVQCIAMLEKPEGTTRPATGNVMSPTALFRVHYFDILSTPTGKQTAVRGQKITFNYTVNANPPPPLKYLSLLPCAKGSCKPLSDATFELKEVAKKTYLVKARFTAQMTGSYRLQFRSAVVSLIKTATPVDLSVTYLQFQTCGFKFEGKNNVRLECLLSAEPLPRKTSFFLISGNRTKAKEPHFLERKVTALKNGSVRLDLIIPYNRSETLKVGYQSSYLKSFSKEITVIQPPKPDKGGMVTLGIIIGLLIVIILIIGVVCYRYRKKLRKWIDSKTQGIANDVHLTEGAEASREKNNGKPSGSDKDTSIDERPKPSRHASGDPPSDRIKDVTGLDLGPESRPLLPKSEDVPEDKKQPIVLDQSDFQKSRTLDVTGLDTAYDAEDSDESEDDVPPEDMTIKAEVVIFKQYTPALHQSSARQGILTKNRPWHEILQECEYLADDSVAFQCAFCRDTEEKHPDRYVLCFKKPRDGSKDIPYFYANEATGEKIREEVVDNMRYFLAPKWLPRLVKPDKLPTVPTVYVQGSVDFLKMDNESSRPVKDNNSIVLDHRSALFLSGLKTNNDYFPQLIGDEFCLKEEIFPKEDDVAKRYSNLRRFYVFLRHGDKFPAWTIPQDKQLKIFRREHFQLEVQGDRLVVSRSPNAPSNRWRLWTPPLVVV